MVLGPRYITHWVALLGAISGGVGEGHHGKSRVPACAHALWPNIRERRRHVQRATVPGFHMRALGSAQHQTGYKHGMNESGSRRGGGCDQAHHAAGGTAEDVTAVHVLRREVICVPRESLMASKRGETCLVHPCASGWPCEPSGSSGASSL